MSDYYDYSDYNYGGYDWSMPDFSDYYTPPDWSIPDYSDYYTPNYTSEAVFDVDEGMVGGLGGNWLSGLLGLGTQLGAKALGSSYKTQATPGGSRPKVDKQLKGQITGALLPVLGQLGQVAANSDPNQAWLEQYFNEMQKVEANRPFEQEAQTTMLNQMRNKPQLSPETLQALSLIQERAGEDPEMLKRRVMEQLGTSVRGLPPESLDDMAAFASARDKEVISALLGVGKQRESIEESWRNQLGIMAQQYANAYGPERLEKLLSLYNLPLNTKLDILTRATAPMASIGNVLGRLALPGQVSVGGTPAEDTWMSALMNGIVGAATPSVRGQPSPIEQGLGSLLGLLGVA